MTRSNPVFRTEKQLYNWLKHRHPEYHWQRFEDKFSTGIPDTNVATGHLGEHWFELKIGQWNDEGEVRVYVDPAQRAWHARRGQVVENSWLVIAVGREVFFIRPRIYFSVATRRAYGKKKSKIYYAVPLAPMRELHDQFFAGNF